MPIVLVTAPARPKEMAVVVRMPGRRALAQPPAVTVTDEPSPVSTTIGRSRAAPSVISLTYTSRSREMLSGAVKPRKGRRPLGSRRKRHQAG